MTADEIQEIKAALKATGGNITHTARKLGLSRSTLQGRIEIINRAGEDVVTEAIKVAKQKQGLQDRRRIENKTWRENARAENAVSAYTEEIVKILRGHKFSTPPKSKKLEGPEVGIVHWSDHHLNERVTLPTNRYDWNIASKRLHKHVQAVKRACKSYGVSHVLVAFTGDLLNSDRRLDELLANAGNRAKASVLALDLYQQAIRDLNRDLDVTVASVCGNESRIPKDLGWMAEIASDNFDFSIYEHLKLLLDDTGINFAVNPDPSESVVKIGNQHVLLIHGHSKLSKADTQKQAQGIMGEYALKGIKIDMIIFGHLHEAHIADIYARSSSLVGSNDYSEKALGYCGRASQNFYILHNSGGFDGLKIDLQDTNGIEGYNIEPRLVSYNTKSADKLKKKDVIHQIVI